MTNKYLKCRADLNFEVDFGVNGFLLQACMHVSAKNHWYDCDQVGSYFIWIMDRFLL